MIKLKINIWRWNKTAATIYRNNYEKIQKNRWIEEEIR
jgi:hypothetical protein